MITNSSQKSKAWIPLTCVDLQSVYNNEGKDALVFSGIENKNSDLELLLYNIQGPFSVGPCVLNVLLGYTEFFQLSNGKLMKLK